MVQFLKENIFPQSLNQINYSTINTVCKVTLF